jgi:hypothetical protein
VQAPGKELRLAARLLLPRGEEAAKWIIEVQ